MIFLDPTSDLAFKKLFSSKHHTTVIIDFLNNILLRKEGEKIVSVIVDDPNNHPENITGKASIVDARCVDQTGTTYIIEMQVMNHGDFLERCQYYSAVAIARQLQKAQGYVSITPVIFVGIVCFDLFNDPNEYLSHHFILNTRNNRRFLKSLEFHFIELTNFHKKLEQLEDDTERWIYLLKNAPEFRTIPKEFKNSEALKEALGILEQGNWSNKELAAYERDIDLARVAWSQLATAKKEGVTEGRAEGELQAKLEMAQKLLPFHDVALVAELTGLSSKEIKNLKQSAPEKSTHKKLSKSVGLKLKQTAPAPQKKGSPKKKVGTKK